MKKSTDAPSLEVLSNSWDDSPFIQWLSHYGRIGLLILIVLLALVALFYRLAPGGSEKAEKDYFNADIEFQNFEHPISGNSDLLASKEALNRLEAIMKRRPELHAKYDGLIAQTLIFREDMTAATPFANLAMTRTAPENHPFYTDYAQTSLLIGSQQYQEALARAQELQKKMTEALSQTQDINKRAFGDTLYAFNLVRIGILQQQQGLNQDELNTWQEWKRLLQQKSEITQAETLSKAFAQQLAHFTNNTISLMNYIEAREKILEKK